MFCLAVILRTKRIEFGTSHRVLEYLVQDTVRLLQCTELPIKKRNNSLTDDLTVLVSTVLLV